MQASQIQSHRSIPRRTNLSQNNGVNAAGGSFQSQTGRGSIAGSSKSPTVRMETNLNKIEESVTNLLRATKELLETLTKWSRLAASDKDVSDVYVKLGSHFNIACRAFTAIGVETADLGNVPDILRVVLESTLSQEASPQSLEVYLPRIREIIIDLLQGLKRKQKKLGPRTKNTDTTNSRPGQDKPYNDSRQDSQNRRTKPEDYAEDSQRPPRTSSLPPDYQAAIGPPQVPNLQDSAYSFSESVRESLHSTSTASTATSSLNPNAYVSAQDQIMPQEDMSGPPLYTQASPQPNSDALQALAREPSFKRRASQRYSQFQIQKLTGSSPNNVPIFGSATPTPRIPIQSRESIDAGRNRGSIFANRHESTAGILRPVSTIKRKISVSTQPQEHAEKEAQETRSEAFSEPDTPLMQTPIDKLSTAAIPQDRISATITTPPPTFYMDPGTPTTPVEASGVTQEGYTMKPNDSAGNYEEIMREADRAMSPTSRDAIQNDVEGEDVIIKEPEATVGSMSQEQKEMTVFFQLGRSMKKVVLQEELEDLSLNTLRLSFISKFAYNPPSGEDFPEIYIQDPVSGIRYELEDISDLKDRSIICLNVEVLDEVKRHIDDGIASLRQVVEGVNSTIQMQAKAIQQVADKQNETSKIVNDFASRSPMAPSFPKGPGSPFGSRRLHSVGSITRTDRLGQVSEVKAIKKDFAVLRQTYNSFVTDVTSSMTTIKVKAASVRNVALSQHGSNGVGVLEGRTALEAGKKMLGTDADTLVARVDDLQDAVEDLRKDVVTRGVRPHPRQLDGVTKELAKARTELKKMSDYIKKEKPHWKKVWERELEVVCEDQQFFNLQEELVADLKDDLEKASQTFSLVEQCTEQQLKTSGGTLRTPSIGVGPSNLNSTLDPGRAKEHVLTEVRALRPNHENRLEAIERAEKLRKKDLEGRASPFKQELGAFVEENKLKKSGGIFEAERLRKQKDEELRRGIFKSSGDNSSVASEDSLANAINSISADNVLDTHLNRVSGSSSSGSGPENVEKQSSNTNVTSSGSPALP